MKVLKLDASTRDACVEEAARVLKGDGLVVYPTDTVYGLAADAFSDIAVEKIYACKGRDENKPIHAVIERFGQAAEFAVIPEAAQKLANAFLPGPLTLVLSYKGSEHAGIMRRMRTIGVRVPNNDFCLALARAYGRPFTTTSANRSGMSTERAMAKLLAQFDDASAYFDLAIDAGELPVSKPSTVVDVSGAAPVILREGAIARADIWKALRS